MAGGTFPQDDFGFFWKNSPGGGIGITYPFHEQLPVSVSVFMSRHKPVIPGKTINDYNIPRNNIFLVNFRIGARYSPGFVKKRKIKPLLLFGFNNTVFISYTDEISLSDNKGEIELGIDGGGGISVNIWKSISVQADYIQNVTFTEPKPMLYGMARFIVRYEFRFKERM